MTNSDQVSFQPLYSPDGKEIAFLENRTAIRVINLDTKEVRTVMDGKYEYSYSDGDQWYQWSPDGKWIQLHLHRRMEQQGRGSDQRLRQRGDVRPDQERLHRR